MTVRQTPRAGSAADVRATSTSPALPAVSLAERRRQLRLIAGSFGIAIVRAAHSGGVADAGTSKSSPWRQA